MDPESNLKSKVAVIGSRGIPNKYGGFEDFTQRLSVELVERDYEVYVSCEGKKNVNCPEIYKGVNLFYFPFKPSQIGALRMVYEILYDFYSLVWASRNADYIYILGYSAGIFFFIPHLFGKKLIVNPDGLEWKRSKFNSFIKLLLKVNEKLATIWADEIIADSRMIKEYLDNKYNTQAKFIPYRAVEFSQSSWDADKLPDKLQEKVAKNKYWLIVARLEPENNIHLIMESYLKSKTKKPLIIVGNYSSQEYQKKIENINITNKKLKNKTIIFTGGIYQREILEMLRQNCFAYIHGHSVGGTNPSLLEAMMDKNLIIAHDNQFNREVCQDSALFFQDSQKLSEIMDNFDYNIKEIQKLKNKAYDRVKENYQWINIIEDYLALFSDKKPYLKQSEVRSDIKLLQSKQSK